MRDLQITVVVINNDNNIQYLTATNHSLQEQ